MAVLVMLLTRAAPAATITVSSAGDSGAGTLRQAILDASASGDTIRFAASVVTIDLTSGELSVNKSLTISGPGPSLLTVRRSAASRFRIFRIAPGCTVAISGLKIADGKTPAFPQEAGAGILNAGTLTIGECTISGNQAAVGLGGSADSLSGGGVFNTGTLTIVNSTVSGNSAGYSGGGLENWGRATINNSTFSGNSAGSATNGPAGGAIRNLGTLTLVGSTVSGNSAVAGMPGGSVGGGGGIYTHSVATSSARSSIVALNTSSLNGLDVSGALTSEGWNLIGTDAGAAIASAQSSDRIGTANSPIDPMLGPLQANGGPTFTRALLPGSPALDAGDDAVLDPPLSFATDQRGAGFPRKSGAQVDIGAFEFAVSSDPPVITAQPASVTVAVHSDAAFSVTATGAVPLAYRWRKDGVDLAGATSDSLTLSNVQFSQAGNYTVVVTNAYGSAASGAAVLSVSPPAPGRAVAWGRNDLGQTTVPDDLTGVTAIAAGSDHTVALKSDGTVVAWGRNDSGQATVPAGLSGVTAIAAGGDHTVALKSDGTVVAWGDNSSGQTDIPAGLSGVTAIAAGGGHTVALKSDGTVLAWADDASSQTAVPAGLSGVTAIAAGFEHTVALVGATPGAEPLALTKLGIRLNLVKDGGDSIELNGALPIPDGVSLEGKALTVDIGGVTAAFVLNAKGKSSPAGLKLGPKAGPAAKFSVKLSRGRFAAMLADKQITAARDAKGEPRSVMVRVIFNGGLYETQRAVRLSAKKDRWASVK